MVNKSTGKSSTAKSKASSSLGKRTKSSSGKKEKLSNTKKAMTESTQTTPKEKKGSSLTGELIKSLTELAKNAWKKESKKQNDESQKVSGSNGLYTTLQSGNSSSGVANNSTKKVITGKETTYATGAAGIYNARRKIILRKLW